MTESDKYKHIASWSHAGIIAFIIAGSYLVISCSSTLWDRDEPRFCRATAEMIQTGNFLYPTFNGQLRPDKPIMIYWAMSIPMRLLGQTELACRFCSCLAMALSCLVIWRLGCRFFNPDTGVWAMIILSTSAMPLFMGTFATADALLLAFMMLAMLVWYDREGQISMIRILLLGLLLGGALLTKGPVGLLPVLVIAVTGFINRREVAVTRAGPLSVLFALLIGIGFFVAWGIPANNATNGEFFQLGIGHHVIKRSVNPLENHGGDLLLYLPYYLPVILIGFFPWTVFLPGAICAVLRKEIGVATGRRTLIGWALSVLVLMTLVMTKLPHYVIFMWPALSLATAATLNAANMKKVEEKTRKWLRGGIWFLVPLIFPAGLVLMIGPWFTPIPALKFPGLLAGLIMMSFGILVIRNHLKERYLLSAQICTAGMILFMTVVATLLIPAIETVKISPKIVDAILDSSSPDAPVACYSYKEPTLNFYLNRHIDYPDRDELQDWCSQPEPGYLIIPADILQKLNDKLPNPIHLKEFRHIAGINYSNGKEQEILILQRHQSEG